LDCRQVIVCGSNGAHTHESAEIAPLRNVLLRCAIIPTKVLLEECKIEGVIRRIGYKSFTVLDFTETLRVLYPQDWKTLVKRFGEFGEKRRYTVTTYLANRLDLYSHRPNSLLVPLTHYSKGKLKDYRKTAREERRGFGSAWIAVFTKKH